MVLYVNACVRKGSRTDRIARALLHKLGGEYEEVRLEDEKLEPLSEERLEQREALIRQGDFDRPMFRLALQFQQAETIVVAAPFWDLSFPSLLKLYLENIYVVGLMTRYGPDGVPHGLCKAKKLYYVTTAGGPYVPDYSYNYLRDLAVNCFGIGATELIRAEMLDVEGFDAKRIVEDTIRTIPSAIDGRQ